MFLLSLILYFRVNSLNWHPWSSITSSRQPGAGIAPYWLSPNAPDRLRALPNGRDVITILQSYVQSLDPITGRAPYLDNEKNILNTWPLVKKSFNYFVSLKKLIFKKRITKSSSTTRFIYNSRFIAAAYSHKKLFPSKCSNFARRVAGPPPPSVYSAGLLTPEILSL